MVAWQQRENEFPRPKILILLSVQESSTLRFYCQQQSLLNNQSWGLAFNFPCTLITVSSTIGREESHHSKESPVHLIFELITTFCV